MKVQLSAYGENAVLVYADELSNAPVRCLLEERLGERPIPQLLEWVWGATNLLLIFSSVVSEARLRAWFEALEDEEESLESDTLVREVPVDYSGPDLEWLAKETELSCEEVVAIHSQPVYTVRMMGFSPGFPYLDGLDRQLHVDRRAQPRQRIAAGSVAIGGAHAGIYSVASPGGWHILGHTDLPIFKPELVLGSDPSPSQVFALKPGDRIRFLPK